MKIMIASLRYFTLLGCLVLALGVAAAQVDEMSPTVQDGQGFDADPLSPDVTQSLLLKFRTSSYDFTRSQSFYLTISFYHVQYGTSTFGGYAPIVLQKAGSTVASFDWRTKLPANPCTSAKLGPFVAGTYHLGGGIYYFASGGSNYVIQGDGGVNMLIVQ